MRKGIAAFWSALLAACSCAGTPADAVSAAAADVARLPDGSKHTVAYLWHPGPEKATAEFDAVIRFMANSLSRKSDLEPPARVAPDLWRIDRRDYGWSRATWDKFADIDPYFHVTVRKAKSLKVVGSKRKDAFTAVAPWVVGDAWTTLEETTGTKAPLIRADWWLSLVSRQLSPTNEQLGVGYYDFLRIKNRADFLNLVRFRLDDSIELGLDRLAAVSKSKVSQQNRQVHSHQALTGRAYFTLDVKNPKGAGNAIRNLRRGDYKHDAEEWYLPGLNGLPFMFLGNAQGERQDSAPDFIGSDHSALNQANDGRIHVFIACVRCHAGNVLQPVEDWARRNFTVGKMALLVPSSYKELGQDAQYKLFRELKRQWLSDFNGPLQAQRFAYQSAIIAATGVTSAEVSNRFARAYHSYVDAAVGPEQAALELGVTVEEMKAAFLRFVVSKGGIDPQLGGLLGATEVIGGAVRFVPNVAPEPIPRLAWEELYPLAQKYMSGDLR